MSSSNGSSSEQPKRHDESKASSTEKSHQQRICSHMNDDHRDTLSLLLEVYCRVPHAEAESAKLEDIQLGGLKLSTASYPGSKSRTNFFIPFEPPLNDYGEARHKIVDMHKYSLQQLGSSDITITEYRRPRGFGAVLFTASLLTFITFSRRSNFEPGSELYSRLLHYVPGFASFCYTIQPPLMGIMLVVHLTEAVYLAVTRLRPYNVPFASPLWLGWFVTNFIEGFTVVARFDALVAEKRAEKAQHKR